MNTDIKLARDLVVGDILLVGLPTRCPVRDVRLRMDEYRNVIRVEYATPNGSTSTVEWSPAQTVTVVVPPPDPIIEFAEWLVAVGYPYDFRTEPPCPEAVRGALTSAWMRHDNITDDREREMAMIQLAEEAGW